MFLACNYSHALLRLLDEGRARVDFIKCSRLDVADAEVRAAADYARVLTHFLPAVDAPAEVVDSFPWDWLNHLNREVGAPWMASHLEAAPPEEAAGVEPEALEEQERVGTAIILSAREMRDRLEVPLHLELVPWSGRRPLYRCCVEPEFVRAVLELADCPLLLDTAHARISAHRLGHSIEDYLSALPLERVLEIHCSGVAEEEGELRDRHGPLAEEDYALLEWLGARCPAQVITLEYGGTGPKFEARTDAAALEAQLGRLGELCRRS